MKSVNERLNFLCKYRSAIALCILTFCGLVISNSAMSQEESNTSDNTDKLSIGFVGGATLNSFNFNGMMLGFSSGAYFKYQLSPALDLQPELKYSMLGGVRRNAIQDYSSIGGNVNSIELFNRGVQISTVDIPVLLRFSPSAFRTENFTPRILAGGYFAYAFDLTEHQDKLFNFSDGTRVFTSGLIQDVSDYYEKGNYGFIVGFGLEFTGATNAFGIDLRYRQGINESSLVGFAPEYMAGSIRMSSLSIDFSFQIFH